MFWHASKDRSFFSLISYICNYDRIMVDPHGLYYDMIFIFSNMTPSDTLNLFNRKLWYIQVCYYVWFK